MSGGRRGKPPLKPFPFLPLLTVWIFFYSSRILFDLGLGLGLGFGLLLIFLDELGLGFEYFSKSKPPSYSLFITRLGFRVR